LVVRAAITQKDIIAGQPGSPSVRAKVLKNNTGGNEWAIDSHSLERNRDAGLPGTRGKNVEHETI
jgi:hypothetical protein